MTMTKQDVQPVQQTGGQPDPTANVIALTGGVEHRLTDLIASAAEKSGAEIESIRKEIQIRTEHAREVRELISENARSTRLIDLANAEAKATSLQTAVQALATQLATSNVAADKRVADLAVTLATAKAVDDAKTNAQIAELQKASYTGAGKQQYSEPAYDKLAALVEKMAEVQANSGGRGTGRSDVVGWVFGGIGVISAIIAIVVALSKVH